MEGTFKGKRALITGGGGGIGKEIVLLLKRKGANVVIIDRSKNDLEALKKEIECDTILADLSDAEQAKKAAERALPVDLLVNCAGVNNLQPFLESTVENFEETINVNTRAIMIVSQVVARNMGYVEGQVVSIMTLSFPLPMLVMLMVVMLMLVMLMLASPS